MSEKEKILAIEVLRPTDRKGERVPFSFILKPPSPPDDLAEAGQL